jgi:hypothetical protein
MKKLLFLVLTTSFLATSCKKYSDGGLVGRADKRLSEHAWKLDKYLRNGNDETSQLLISNFTENFAENGTITRSYTDSNGDPFSESGTWAFDNDKMQINLTGVGSIELTNQTSTVSSSDYNIIRLKKHELWYYYENGGSRHEFHLIK